MELKIRRAFVFLAPIAAALAGGLKNEWAFLSFSVVSAVFFLYEKQGLEPEDAWFLYFVWISFASLFSHSPVLSFFTAFKWLVFYLFYSYFKSRGGEELKKFFIYSLLAVSFVCSALLFGEYGVSWPYSFGIIGKNRNYTAILLMLSSTYFFYSYFKNSGRLAGAFRLAGAVFFLFPVIMLNSRGALIFLIASYAAVLLIFKKKRFLFYSLACAVVAALLLPRSFLENFLKLDDAAGYMRPYLWKSALRGIFEYPLTGYGPGLFENVFELFKFRHFDGVSYFNHTTLHAHSEILNIAAESGLVGGILFLLAFYKTMVSKGSGPDSALFKIFAAALFMQGLLDVIFYLPLTGLFFLASCGFAENSPSRQNERRGKSLYPALLLALAAVSPYFFRLGEVKKAYGEEDYAAFFSAFEKSDSDPGMLRKAIILASPNSPRIAALSDFAARRHPYEADFFFEGARCALLGGAPGESEELLKKALFLEPNFKKARLLLAETLLAEKEPFRAGKNLAMVKKGASGEGKKKNSYNRDILDFDLNIYKNLEKKAGE